MTAHTDVQIINGPNGAPAYVVIPYADYIASHPESDLIPHDVVGMVVKAPVFLSAYAARKLRVSHCAPGALRRPP